MPTKFQKELKDWYMLQDQATLLKSQIKDVVCPFFKNTHTDNYLF